MLLTAEGLTAERPTIVSGCRLGGGQVVVPVVDAMAHVVVAGVVGDGRCGTEVRRTRGSRGCPSGGEVGRGGSFEVGAVLAGEPVAVEPAARHQPVLRRGCVVGCATVVRGETLAWSLRGSCPRLDVRPELRLGVSCVFRTDGIVLDHALLPESIAVVAGAFRADPGGATFRPDTAGR
jgi:hypothetical protein